LKRRLVAGGLVVLSLVLITIYFREPASGGLHDAQGVGASVLRPFEVGVDRVARPFRDGYGYLSELIHAKSENARLRAEIDQLRQQVILNQNAVLQNEDLKKTLKYVDSPNFPKDYKPVLAGVMVRPPSQFEQQIVVSKGSSDGIRKYDPVATADGLVGSVTKVTSHAAQVTLLTDETSNVSAIDLYTGAPGIVRHTQAGSASLSFDRVTRDRRVHERDPVVTARWRSGKLCSEYPTGIAIGTVASVGQNDTDFYKQIQIEPFVDFGSINTVVVLVSKKRLPCPQ
jgi:rod shape-determining protein MreC